MKRRSFLKLCAGVVFATFIRLTPDLAASPVDQLYLDRMAKLEQMRMDFERTVFFQCVPTTREYSTKGLDDFMTRGRWEICFEE